jgi:hypothetical protein
MDAKQFNEGEGTFGQWTKTALKCQCGAYLMLRKWEPNCGGHTDHKYECQVCQHSFWVKGPDHDWQDTCTQESAMQETTQRAP